ncbi:hypothetical protein Q4560_06125 [Celeribacter halophilus]|uniref:Flp pilus assembly protein, pilin Flp n=1 Tax=Celeribacter halophilus TaxID=576117 RepID=A0AAW7XR39_9RHOB|nr:hypothetical protein [Celeribacter halophilus]MDO6456372.1 hypothetical protein [Celeribacter halophilus]MDO6722835.1 hypothetical protein [Celeribacter halophilus]
MILFSSIYNFHREEDGAVTVDWVVLTAAIVGLGIAVMTAVAPGITDLGGKISDDLSTMNTTTYSVDTTTDATDGDGDGDG